MDPIDSSDSGSSPASQAVYDKLPELTLMGEWPIDSIDLNDIQPHQTESKRRLSVTSLTTEEIRKQTDKILVSTEFKNKHVQIEKEYIQIKKEIQDKMKTHFKNINKYQLRIQCENEHCGKNKSNNDDGIWNQCPSLQRIQIILEGYQFYLKNINLYKKVAITPLVTYPNTYGLQQITDDFLHIKIFHIDINSELAQSICTTFEDLIKCDNVENCTSNKAYHRHRESDQNEFYFRIKTDDNNKRIEIVNDKDIVIRQECDKMHCFFLHSSIKYGSKPYGTNDQAVQQEQDIIVDQNTFIRQEKEQEKEKEELNTINEDTEHKYDKDTDDNYNEYGTYFHAAEDKRWWKDVKIKNYNEYITNTHTSDTLYKTLISNMRIFKWQSSTGFRTGQNRNVYNLKPKHKNLKEEALYNKYYPLGTGNWNQTWRKSKNFFNSWARSRIRTKVDGRFEDKVTQTISKWTKGTEISLQEIITLKLYTDFDELQFALKKSFRFETLKDVFRYRSTSTNKLLRTPSSRVYDTNQSSQLEDRLSEFYYWRVSLMVVLNKFGTGLNDNGNGNKSLYFGVNEKMIINRTHSLAFYGPLSTSSSYHVARGFAKESGMVLEISSMYPRLNLCNAFDASLISDYPEEQEWLVGFMYVRINEITTRKLVDAYDPGSFLEILKIYPMATMIKNIFFAMHLFHQQIFSMSDECIRVVTCFLRLHFGECCNEKTINEKSEWNNLLFFLCKKVAGHNTKHKIKDLLDLDKIIKELELNYSNDLTKTIIVLTLLWKKFNKYTKRKDFKLAIDKMSDDLTKYFFDKEKNGEKYSVVSFEKILSIYPNVEEIQFLNQYKFDQIVLNKLISFIDGGNNKSLKRIKFSYYDYPEGLKKPSDVNYFYDPEQFVENKNKNNVKFEKNISSIKSMFAMVGKNKTKLEIRHYGNNVGYQIKIIIG